jgi:phage terminase large subunit GpA-like protein
MVLTTPKASMRAIELVAEASRVLRRRTMRQFAEDEIVLPTGQYQDERFKVERQPWTGLWFAELDSGRWRRHVMTGVGQGGKTLCGSTLPVLYHLFECRETVIYAAPTMDMAADKWRQDILPVIRASRYRDLLPDRGGGARGGTPTSIEFKHGPTLRFMTGGGSDKVRAAFTSRVAVITETDGMDEAGGSSRETDKVSQVEARTSAYPNPRIYQECTVSTEEGRTWRELKGGTDSRIIMPCPHCMRWVTPEREHLIGWQDAADVTEASEGASLCCPSCGSMWTEQERVGANRRAKLVHRGQDVAEDGTVLGLIPRTLTLGFRFTAANNLLVPISRVAEEEWGAPRTTDPDLAEKKLRQFYWALPSEPESIVLSEMDTAAITKRSIDVPRGRVPADCGPLTIGIDVGKWLCHWVAVAWRSGGTPHVVEYGRIEVPSNSMAEELAILTALRRFRDEVCKIGWPGVSEGQNHRPSMVLVDSGNWESTVVAFCAESGAGFLPSKGFGVRQLTGRKIAHEPGYEAKRQQAGHVLVEINADHWKSFVHARLQTPPGEAGGLSLFHGTPTEHLSFAKHLTAEKRVEEFIAGRGLVSRWEAVNRNNHFLDALAMACVAGHGVGEKVVVQPVASPPQPAPSPVVERPSWMPDRPTGWTNR